MLTLYQLKQEILTRLQTQYTAGALTTAAPVLTRPLDSPNNIVLSGIISTNDGTTDGRPFYVTVLRKTGYPSPEDGFGFAVIKGNVDGTLTDYNVFIVDNNPLVDNYVVGARTLIGTNMNRFVSAGKVVFNINIDYNFEFRISNDWSTELFIWQVGTTKPGTPTLISGAIQNGPLSYGDQVIQDPTTGVPITTTTGQEVGFGVSNPSTYQWYISQFAIASISGGIPLQIFEFVNSTTFKEGITGPIQLTYFGSGQVGSSDFTTDPVTGAILTGSVVESGLDFYIACSNYNVSGIDDIWTASQLDGSAAWEYLGSSCANHYAVGDTYRKFVGVTQHDAPYYEFEGVVYIAVTKNFNPTGSGANLATASIKTEYIELSSDRRKTFRDRNVMDIWIDPLTFIEQDQVETILWSDEYSPQPQIIPEMKQPVFCVTSIVDSTLPSINRLVNNANIGVQPIASTLGLSYSLRDTFSVQFPNSGEYSMNATDVIITYYHVNTKVTALQNFLDTSTYRAPGCDPLIRIMPPILFTIDPAQPLNYKGSSTTDEVKQFITSFILTLGYNDALRKSDIVADLYSHGITYLDLNNLHFYITIYDYKDYWVDRIELVDSYTPSTEMSRWYTNVDLINVVNINNA